MRLLVLAPFLVLVVLGGPAWAQDRVAPLPNGIEPSNRPKVQGLYAEAEFGRIDVIADLEAFESGCKSRGVDVRVEGRELLWKGKHRLYRTRTSVAVFEDSPAIKVDEQSCSAAITLARSVRAKSGASSEIGAAGWIDQHPPCSRFRRCKETTIAGVKARCADLGDGLVGSTICYSLQADLSKDLIVARSSYTDDGSGPDSDWALDVVLPHVLIDPIVFTNASSP